MQPQNRTLPRWTRFGRLVALSGILISISGCATDGSAPKLPTTIHDFCLFYKPYPYHLSDGPEAVAAGKESLKNHECLCGDDPPAYCKETNR